MKLFKKCSLILYIILIFLFIISCIKQSNQYIWGSILLMLIVMIVDAITSLYIKHQTKKQYNFPTNFNYKILPINISRTDGRKVGALYSPIRYIYVNLNRKTLTFPESKYGIKREYILMKIDNTHTGKILNLKYAKNRIKIKVHKITEKQIKLLEKILYHSHNYKKYSNSNNNDNLFLKILKHNI